MNKKIFFFFFLFLLIISTLCNKSERLTKLGWQELKLVHLGIKKEATLALNYFDMALIRSPNNVKALHGSGLILASNKMSLQNGISKLKKAFQLDKHYFYPCIDLAQIYYKRALSTKKKKYKKMALKIIEEALKANPQSVELFLSRANIFAMLKKFKEAKKDVTIAQSIDPSNIQIPYSRILIYFLQNNLAKVLELSNKVLNEKMKGNAKNKENIEKKYIKIAIVYSFVIKKWEEIQNKERKLLKKKLSNKVHKKIEERIKELETKKTKLKDRIIFITNRFTKESRYYYIAKKLRNFHFKLKWPVYAFPESYQ